MLEGVDSYYRVEIVELEEYFPGGKSSVKHVT